MSQSAVPRRALTEVDMERMRIPRRFWSVSVAGIQESNLREPLLNYLDTISEKRTAGLGMLLMGDNGRGKTASGCLILMEARRQYYTSLFVEGSRLRGILFDSEMFDANQRLWDRMVQVDFLLIDDWGKGTSDVKGYASQILDDLIRLRSAELRPTIITTNLDLPKIRESEAIRKSTVEALLECVLFLEVGGANLRAKQVVDVVARFRA